MHVIPEWLELISLTFCMGVIVCRLWFFAPSVQREFSYQGNFVPAMWRLFCYGLAVLIAGSIVELIVRASEISGRPLAEISSVLPVVLMKTHYGTVWLIRIGALILLALSKTVVRYRDRRAFLTVMLLFGLVVTMTSSASGHASDAGDFRLPEIMDWLHLLAASAWGGGLMVLSISVLPALMGSDERSVPLIARVAGRFSALAGIAVGIVAATALYNAWSYVGGSGAAWETPYGLIVIAKIILFLVLINLGAFNRYVSVPLLRDWAGFSPGHEGIVERIAGMFFAPFLRNRSGEQVAMRFRRSVGLEALLIVAVLLCAALLRHEIPARHAGHMAHQGEQGHSMQHNGGMNMDHPADHHEGEGDMHDHPDHHGQ